MLYALSAYLEVMSEIAMIRPAARWARSTGRRVRGRLAESEVSQERAAQVLGLSQAAMSRRLSGRVDFTISELLDLAEWLGVTLDDLLPREVANGNRPQPVRAEVGGELPRLDSNQQPAGSASPQVTRLDELAERRARIGRRIPDRRRATRRLTPHPFGPFRSQPIAVMG